MEKYMMALDQGTTSSRCILFDRKGNICSVAQKEFEQHYPKPGCIFTKFDYNGVQTRREEYYYAIDL